jgi:hyperosmotically inducible protein
MSKYYSSFLIALILVILMTSCGTIHKSTIEESRRGAQESDERITMAIRKNFSEDETLKFYNISTYCYNGHVYLVGEYDSLNQKNQAVKLAKKVDGVKSVDEILLPKGADNTCRITTNLELLAKVKKDLISNMNISSTQIEVTALQCNIILLGLADAADDIEKAALHAKSVEGVRSVSIYMKIKK